MDQRVQRRNRKGKGAGSGSHPPSEENPAEKGLSYSDPPVRKRSQTRRLLGADGGRAGRSSSGAKEAMCIPQIRLADNVLLHCTVLLMHEGKEEKRRE